MTNISIESLIFCIRNENVMLDRDLANLYDIETKHLNRAVQRNRRRFEGYFFRLSKYETSELVTNCHRLSSLKHSSSYPYVFNEYGILMLSSVLKSDTAIDINRRIISTFVKLRQQFSPPHLDQIQQQIELLKKDQENIILNQKIESKSNSDKILNLSKKVSQLSEALEEFDDAYLVIKRP